MFRYRFDVIDSNLTRSFPQKIKAEKKVIIERYYHFITDLMAENLKAISISEEELAMRCTYKNIELFDQYIRQNRSVTILTSHYGNFEWMLMTINKKLPLQVYSFYNEITNPYFRKLILGSRMRNGLKLILTKDSFNFYKQAAPEVYANIFAADQSPSNLKKVYWTNFLNQDTAFVTGLARYAKMHQTAIVYMRIDQTQRGFYEISFNSLYDDCSDITSDEIMSKYVSELESQIIKKPELWLWSHKRWKRKRESI